MKSNLLKIFSTLIIICISSFMTIGCSKKQAETSPLKRSEVLMGTVVSITLYDNQNENTLNSIFDKIKELEAILSINTSGTLIDKINESAGVEPIKVDNDTYKIIKDGLYYSELSDGRFDITIGPLVKLWNIGLPEARVPSQDEIDSALHLINYKNVELNDSNQTVFLKYPGMMLDLGGIAKGYTADVISKILLDNNVTSAIIDLGGNVYAHGTKISGEEWKVGIQNPFSNRGDIIGSISTSNKSIVTSGIYERFLEHDGVKYHHILNPKAGYPYTNDLAGITIISDKSIDGDALSTSVFAMGLDEGLKFIESLDDIDAIFVTKDKQVYTSSGVKNAFKITNTEFTLSN